MTSISLYVQPDHGGEMYFKGYLSVLRNEHKILKRCSTEKGKKNFIAAELIRNTHSIEKGLSIALPRLGFGHAKQKEMMDMVEELIGSDDLYHQEACCMAVSALKAYLEYHNNIGYSDEFMSEISEFLNEHNEIVSSYGGIIELHKDDFKSDTEAIERFFNNRHSIRDFSDIPVNDDTILKALKLAQCAPSACNRQAVRAYVLSHEKSMEASKSMAGIGGFVEAVDRFIMITGKTSAYRTGEINQYIVSASIYAAYLTMTLHLYGVGCCVVQRTVTWSKQWENMREEYGVPCDEQIVLMLAVGNLKDNYVVPVSHRLDVSLISKFIE